MSLGNLYRTVTAKFVETLPWSPSGVLPGASLCVTYLGGGSYDMPFLPFQISKEYVPRIVSVTMLDMSLMLIQTKSSNA